MARTPPPIHSEETTMRGRRERGEEIGGHAKALHLPAHVAH